MFCCFHFFAGGAGGALNGGFHRVTHVCSFETARVLGGGPEATWVLSHRKSGNPRGTPRKVYFQNKSTLVDSYQVTLFLIICI